MLSVLYLDGNQYTSDLPTFIKLDTSKNLFTFTPNADKIVGTHILSLNITDTNISPKTRLVPLTVIV